MNRLLLAYNLALSSIISVYQRTYPITLIIISTFCGVCEVLMFCQVATRHLYRSESPQLALFAT